LTERALQEQIPHNHCFGCGPANDGGLHLKSYWSGAGPSRARFSPEPHHCAGPTHFVNGGIIATLIDCHAVCTATAAAYTSEHRPIGSSPRLYFATASLDVRYLRPAPMDAELELEAELSRQTQNGYSVFCRLSANGKVCAEGKLEAVRVPEAWMGLD